MVQTLKSQSSIVALHSKYTRALTFENLYQLHMQPQAQQKKQLWYTFSKVVYTVAIHSKYTRALTFQNLYQAVLRHRRPPRWPCSPSYNGR
jgi:hypothetical protein